MTVDPRKAPYDDDDDDYDHDTNPQAGVYPELQGPKPEPHHSTGGKGRHPQKGGANHRVERGEGGAAAPGSCIYLYNII